MNSQDLIFVGVALAFFVLCAAYAASCEKLR
jgi:hypothetical protein